MVVDRERLEKLIKRVSDACADEHWQLDQGWDDKVVKRAIRRRKRAERELKRALDVLFGS